MKRAHSDVQLRCPLPRINTKVEPKPQKWTFFSRGEDLLLAHELFDSIASFCSIILPITPRSRSRSRSGSTGAKPSHLERHLRDTSPRRESRKATVKLTICLLAISVYIVWQNFWQPEWCQSRGRPRSALCELSSLATVVWFLRGGRGESSVLQAPTCSAEGDVGSCLYPKDPTAALDTLSDNLTAPEVPATTAEGAAPPASEPYLDRQLVSPAQEEILREFDGKLATMMSEDGLFEGQGSFEVALWKLTGERQSVPVYTHAFGKTSFSSFEGAVRDGAFDGQSLQEPLQRHAGLLPEDPALRDVHAVNDPHAPNVYRIASITKSLLGLTTMLLQSLTPFDIDAKLHPHFLDLEHLGAAHCPEESSSADPSSTEPPAACAAHRRYRDALTFRHLVTHTSGLSRESKRGGKYNYGGDRTRSPRCPPEDAFAAARNRSLECDPQEERNWRAWTDHVLPYIMPACGYSGYDEQSSASSCWPGELFHYSNVGYSLLGLALDRWLKGHFGPAASLEEWVEENLFARVGMASTAFNWSDLGRERKRAAAHGFLHQRSGAVLTDFADHGYKVASGGMWSSTADLSRLLLTLDPEGLVSTFGIGPDQRSVATRVLGVDQPGMLHRDEMSEEDAWQMPGFQYGYGWYVNSDYSCVPPEDGASEGFLGSWGSIPGYTSFMLTNPSGQPSGERYAVVILRSYNSAMGVDLGNQARRLLWRMLHPDLPHQELQCPVCHYDQLAQGDHVVDCLSNRTA